MKSVIIVIISASQLMFYTLSPILPPFPILEHELTKIEEKKRVTYTILVHPSIAPQ